MKTSTVSESGRTSSSTRAMTSLRLRLDELEAVAERIVDVRSQLVTDANLLDLVSGRPELPNEDGELSHQQPRVGLPGRSEVRIDAEVNLEVAALEPGSAAFRERGGLRHLGDPEQPRVELPRRVLATGGHRELNMIDADDPHRAHR